MNGDDIKRVLYYEKQFLRPRDFQDEQAYHIEMRRRHNIAHHTWGIVTGLDITRDTATEIWSVQPGMAVDGYGREILVSASVPLNNEEIAAQLAGATSPTLLKIWLTQRLERTDRPAPGYETCDQPGQVTRFRETFRLIYQDDPPGHDQTIAPQPFDELVDDPNSAPWPVFLGSINWEPTQESITDVDLTGRQYIGLVGAEIFSPTTTQILDVHASKTTFDQNIIINGTAGDGHGRLRLDVDNTDASVITNKKAPTPTDPNPASGNIYLRANNELGGKKIIIDRDTLEAMAAQISQDLSVNGKVGIGTTSPDRQLTIQGSAGTYLNVKGDDGEHEVLLGADSNGGIVSTMTNHDLQLRAGGNRTKMIIKTDGNVGIGTVNPITSLHVVGSKNAAATPENHIAFIENTSDGNNADVLCLKANIENPIASNNYISFRGSGDESFGALQGDNRTHTIVLAGRGEDYAEWLPRLGENEVIRKGDIVGVFAGKVTKVTQGAHQVMVISHGPIVLGNMPDEEKKHLYEKVAFIGQVPIRIHGKVKAGDYVIPSGSNDGTAVAISPQGIKPEHYAQIVGQAWESSDQEGLKKINTVVGLHFSTLDAGIISLIQNQQEEIKALRAELESMKIS